MITTKNTHAPGTEKIVVTEPDMGIEHVCYYTLADVGAEIEWHSGLLAPMARDAQDRLYTHGGSVYRAVCEAVWG